MARVVARLGAAAVPLSIALLSSSLALAACSILVAWNMTPGRARRAAR